MVLTDVRVSIMTYCWFEIQGSKGLECAGRAS